MANQERVIIASVTVGEPPASVRTMADWYVWRRQEDERMERELARQREAWFEAQRAIAEARGACET
jgi:hypothetical protein